MKTKLPNIQSELKELSKEIRRLKSTRKSSTYGYVSGLSRAQNEFRHMHIAYCLVHGTPYEKIEQPSEENKADMDWINKLVSEYEDETIHNQLQKAE
jgi:hypothetical protein